MGTALTVFKKSEIVALDDANPAVEALRYNIQMAGGLTDADLPKIKNPSGGALVFELQRAGQAPEYLKDLTGIILFAANRRTLWADKSIGSGDRPVCSSEDCINGEPRTNEDGSLSVPDAILQIAMPGGETGKCATCHFNEWGTAKDSSGKPTKGKACAESKVIYFLRTGEALPCKLTVPSGSLKAFHQAIKILPIRADQAVIKLSLVKDKSSGGVEFAKYQAELVAGLDEAALVALKSYGQLLSSVFAKAQADRDGTSRRQSSSSDGGGDDLEPAAEPAENL